MTRLFIAALPALATLAVALLFLASPVLAAECAIASWYGTESGDRTANGEPFDGRSLTAAHRTMAFGTRIRVEYRGRAVTVRINDRGPFIKGRSLDLSRAAAEQLGLVHAGVGRVCWERLR